MFTGIISHSGKLKSQENIFFTFSADSSLLRKIKKGSSVAINGVCLTVVSKSSDSFSVELMPETISRTAFEDLKAGDLINLELPLKAGDTIDGHFVQGHIDGVGIVESIKKEENSHLFSFKIEKSLGKYIAEKGSVAVNGVSLTVIDAKSEHFTVGIIPYTFKNTNFGRVRTGDRVNIEVDVLAKYVEKLVNS